MTDSLRRIMILFQNIFLLKTYYYILVLESRNNKKSKLENY